LGTPEFVEELVFTVASLISSSEGRSYQLFPTKKWPIWSPFFY